MVIVPLLTSFLVARNGQRVCGDADVVAILCYCISVSLRDLACRNRSYYTSNNDDSSDNENFMIKSKHNDSDDNDAKTVLKVTQASYTLAGIADQEIFTQSSIPL